MRNTADLITNSIQKYNLLHRINFEKYLKGTRVMRMVVTIVSETDSIST
jgi:hypothetical protein